MAAGVSLETGFQKELQEELSEYAFGVPDGKLIHIRAAGGQRLLPLGADSNEHASVPWQEPAGEGDGDKLALSFTDTGEGIPPDELNRVFDRFYRVDPSRTRSKGGFGLGLSIAKWIAESHGGSITAKSEFGLGSTFAVVLPRSADGSSLPTLE